MIPEFLLALDSPLAPVIDARDACHAEQKPIEGLKLLFILEFSGNARNVMVVDEILQMLAGIQIPRVTAALPLECIGHLMHVGRIHGGPEPLVRLIVRHRVAQGVAHP